MSTSIWRCRLRGNAPAPHTTDQSPMIIDLGVFDGTKEEAQGKAWDLVLSGDLAGRWEPGTLVVGLGVEPVTAEE